MNDKRDAYVHTRVTRKEMQVIDALARHLRRTRSDTMRVLALEEAEAMGLLRQRFEPPFDAVDGAAPNKEMAFDVKDAI